MCVVTVMAPQGTPLLVVTFMKPAVLRVRNTQHKGLCSQRQQYWQWPARAQSWQHSGKSPSTGPRLLCPEKGHKALPCVPGSQGFRISHKEGHWLETGGPAVLAAWDHTGFLDNP